ncbi:MAG: hypothetical protein IPM66_04585 [Acidobacteriota bacterium]|nr:MAG: hypothetical protein IPM66_04585 [Acidobacteriota bacterium]
MKKEAVERVAAGLGMRMSLILLVVMAGGVSGGTASGISYRIAIEVDVRGGGFRGRQTVTIPNRSGGELNEVIFHLYPNFGLAIDDQPWLKVEEVKLGGRDLRYEIRARHALLRVGLPEAVPQGGSVDLEIGFSARVPRVQREESSLLAHFLQEISDAVNDEKHLRDARDIFFAGDDAWLLGYFYPQVAVRQFQSLDGEFVAGVGGIVLAEMADYDVTVTCPPGMMVIASGVLLEENRETAGDNGEAEHLTCRFRASGLRGFALALADKISSRETKIGDVRVVSYFREGDERLGERVLNIAATALRTYQNAYGPYPHSLLQVVELPLPAGFCTVDLPSVIAIAQAYYIDFDKPQAARLPGVLREQADVIKSALEFNLALSVAHQWWGEAVANDSERSPYLDESLSAFSAAYYHEAAYGRDLGDMIVQQQLRGVYQAYRMLGGVDQEADRPIRDFKNSLQYTAIASAKGALLLVALRRELGDDRFFKALQYYYSSHRTRIAAPEHLRYAFLAASDDPRQIRSLFQRWLGEKHGDEDIGTPDLTLAPQPVSKIRALGRIFVKIGKTAARPF